MLAVGRRRTKNLHLPAGVRPIGSSLFWQPTSEREREERKAKGMPASAPLGPIFRVRGRIELTKAQYRQLAELSGRDAAPDAAGTVAEILAMWERDGLEVQPNGVRRSENTIKQYRACLPALREKFGACRYGKTEHDASRGLAIGTATIQEWVVEGSKGSKNKALAVLSNAFDLGIRKGKTTYNPCRDVAPNAQEARTRVPAEWEVECLGAMATPLMALMMDFEAITGWRVMDIVRLQRAQLTADGVRARHKRNKRSRWEWTPELRRIIAAAEKLPGATAFPASPVFPTRHRRAYSYSGFNRAWNALIASTNAVLADCAVKLRIEDLHFHDLRSKAHDDAEEMGREGHDLLGNTPRVASKHYARREQRRRPLR